MRLTWARPLGQDLLTMSDSRTVASRGTYPGARFRCLVCQRFTTANDHGVCPSCGFVPPRPVPLAAAGHGTPWSLWVSVLTLAALAAFWFTR